MIEQLPQMMGDVRLASFGLLTPELYLGLATMALLLFGVYKQKQADISVILLGLMIIGFTAYIEAFGYMGAKVIAMNGMFISDRFSCMAKCLILMSGFIVLMLSSGWLQEAGGRPFEYVVLMLLSMLGMMLMVSAGDLLALYMGLEMSSLALYVLASLDRDHTKSSEAGLKYFVLGSLASGMMLFGMSLVYGFAGSTGFGALATLFAKAGAPSQGVVVGLVLIIIGFCFKLSAVPFHMWTPDVYEGAPTPVTAFFATAPKVAAFALFARFLMQPFISLTGEWQQVIVFVSVASMLVGALAAIMQTNIKRLLAYSSIGHAGFMLMGLAAANESGVQATLVYLAIYIFMSAGMFGCVLLMRRGGQYAEEIRDLSGLAQTSPGLAAAIGIFMFSMAGIPPLAGFFGKLYVVIAAIQGGLVWLAVIGMVTSVISCYYYLKVVKIMYFDTPVDKFERSPSVLLHMGIALCVAVTVIFFTVPTPLIAQAKMAAETLLH